MASSTHCPADAAKPTLQYTMSVHRVAMMKLSGILIRAPARQYAHAGLQVQAA